MALLRWNYCNLNVNNYSSGSAVAVTPSPTVDLTKIGTVIAPSTTPETLESLFQSALSPNFNASDANQAANSYSSLNQIASGLQVDISQGVKSQYNKTASEILEFTDKTGKSINVSELLNTIINDLGTSGNTANLTTTDLKDIQSVTTNLLQKRSEVGTMQNRMDSAQGNNETENYNMTDILSKTEDVDYAEATMNYSMMQTVYTASLQTSAKILPMTILSYL